MIPVILERLDGIRIVNIDFRKQRILRVDELERFLIQNKFVDNKLNIYHDNQILSSTSIIPISKIEELPLLCKEINTNVNLKQEALTSNPSNNNLLTQRNTPSVVYNIQNIFIGSSDLASNGLVSMTDVMNKINSKLDDIKNSTTISINSRHPNFKNQKSEFENMIREIRSNQLKDSSEIKINNNNNLLVKRQSVEAKQSMHHNNLSKDINLNKLSNTLYDVKVDRSRESTQTGISKILTNDKNITLNKKIRDMKSKLLESTSSEDENDNKNKNEHMDISKTIPVDIFYEKINLDHLLKMQPLPRKLFLKDKQCWFISIELIGSVPSLGNKTFGVIEDILENEFITISIRLSSNETVSLPIGEIHELWINKNNTISDNITKSKSKDCKNINSKNEHTDSKQTNNFWMEKLYSSVNYYFSDKNYYSDKYIQAHSNNEFKALPLVNLMTFTRVKSLKKSIEDVCRCLQNNSDRDGCNYAIIDSKYITKKEINQNNCN